MPDKQVTVDLCEQKHGELMRGMGHIECKVDSVLSMLNGNGKPGLRETQSDVEETRETVKDMQAIMQSMQTVMVSMQTSVSELQEWRKTTTERKETVVWTLFKQAVPVVYALGLYLLWFALNNQFGAK